MHNKIGELTVAVVERPDVVEPPGLVQDWRLQPVHVVHVGGGVRVVHAVAVQEGALELLVQVAEPGSVAGVGAAGDLVDLVLELLKTWRKIAEKEKS